MNRFILPAAVAHCVDALLLKPKDPDEQKPGNDAVTPTVSDADFNLNQQSDFANGSSGIVDTGERGIPTLPCEFKIVLGLLLSNVDNIFSLSSKCVMRHILDFLKLDGIQVWVNLQHYSMGSPNPTPRTRHLIQGTIRKLIGCDKNNVAKYEVVIGLEDFRGNVETGQACAIHRPFKGAVSACKHEQQISATFSNVFSLKNKKHSIENFQFQNI